MTARELFSDMKEEKCDSPDFKSCVQFVRRNISDREVQNRWKQVLCCWSRYPKEISQSDERTFRLFHWYTILTQGKIVKEDFPGKGGIFRP